MCIYGYVSWCRLRTAPKFLYVGFSVLRSVEDNFLSSNGSCVHLVPFTRRAGSRAGMRRGAPGRRDVDEESVAGAEFGSLGLLPSWVCLEGCELGAVEGYMGEPALVSGVRLLLLEACDGALLARAEAAPLVLKTDEAVLAWELAEPTPLSMSPGSESLSSGAGWAASDDEGGSDLTPSR